MIEVHIWRTTTGVFALTPEAFGCCMSRTEETCEKMRRDLQAGARMSKAVGTFGVCHPLEKLIAMESPVESRYVIIEASVETGRIFVDLTFEQLADRNEFFERITRILGAGWKIERSARKGLLLWILPTITIGIGIVALFYAAIAYFLSGLPRHNVRAVDPPDSENILSLGLGFGIAMIVFGIIIAIWREISGGMHWERICRR